MTESLQKKIDQSLRFLDSVSHLGQFELAYSGGKDSDVILDLARRTGSLDIRPIYKNTTIDPPGTIKHVKDMGVEVRMPRESFAELIKTRGFPTRFSRFCCRELKEYKILDRCIVGVRRDESSNRAARYKEPEQCRVWSKKEKSRQYFPILDWTTKDVKEYIESRGIQCAPVYYEGGVFHAERRLGCMCCPLQSKKPRIEQFKLYPNMVNIYCKNGNEYIRNHRETKTGQRFDDAYQFFTSYVFYDSYEEFYDATHHLFGTEDCKTFLENYFNIKLD